MSGFLLDTNIVSELVRPKPDARVTGWVDSADEDLLYLSVLTLGEIRKGITVLPHARRRAALEAWLETELRSRFAGRLLPVDDAVADRWGLLAGRAEHEGRPIPMIDGLLAATALHHNLVLVTRDVAGLAGTGVPLLNPFEL